MGTIWVKEFTGGLDTRRLPETTPGGVLLRAENGHINRGGEFEKRAAFIKKYQLPAGTVGLARMPGSLVVFGDTVAPALPNGVKYQRLQHPFYSAIKLVRINSFDLYKSGLYVSATFADGDTYHFFNGVHVADFDYGMAKVSFKVTGGVNIATKPAWARFRVTGGTNNVANKITLVRANGVPITQKAIQHTGNNTTTAQAIAKEINRFVSSPNYTAVANADVVTVYASTPGAAINGKFIGVTVTGNVGIASIPPGTTIAFSGGVNKQVSTIDAVVNGIDIMDRTEWRTSNEVTAKAVVAAINGYHNTRDFHAVWDGEDQVTVIANIPGTAFNGMTLTLSYTAGFTTNHNAATNKFAGGKDPPDTEGPVNLPYLPGDWVGTHDRQVYTLSGSTLYYSGIDKPTNFKDLPVNSYPGAGFVDLSSVISGAEELTAFAKYQNYLAVFSYSQIIVRYTDADPKLHKTAQVLRNTGTRSPHSVVQYGDTDIYYLDESGIRSVKARDSSNAASTNDIGVLIDTLVMDKLRHLTSSERLKIFSVVEPAEGRYWLIMKDIIFVFSYFAGAKVSAWTTYFPSIPGTPDPVTGKVTDKLFVVDEALVFRRRIYLRSGNIIYCYGGDVMGVDLIYDTTQALMQTPFLDGNAPAKMKSFQGWDAAVKGVWDVNAVLDSTNPDIFDWIATVDQTTFPANRLQFNAQSSQVSLIFKSRSASKAIIGSGLVHYTMDGEDDGSH